MYAIVRAGGRQEKVEVGSVLVVVLLAWSALMFAVTRGGRFDND